MLRNTQVRFSTMAVILLSMAAAALLVLLVIELRFLISWLFVAGFLALIFNPVIDRLSRRMPRWEAVVLLAVATLALLAGAVIVFLPPFIAQLLALARGAPELVARLREWSIFAALDDRLHLLSLVQEQLANAPRHAGEIAGALATFAVMTARGVTAALTIFFASMFLLQSGPELVIRFERLLRPRPRALFVRVATPIYDAITRYALGSLLIASAAGLVALVIGALAGVPFFLPVALVVGCLGFIPYIGATISAALLFLATWGTVGFARAVAVLIAFLVYQQIENNLWQPLVHQRTVRLSPIVVMIAIIAGVELAGVPGIVFGVPVAGMIQILVRGALALRRERRLQLGEGRSPDAKDGRPP